MANADDILKSVQRCLEYISQKKTPSSPLLKYLDEVRNKLSCRDTPLNEQPNECFNVFATNLLHLWNATLYQNDFFNDVIIFEVIFKLMSFFSFEELSLNQPDYISLYEGNHWLKIKSKIAIKYSQLLLSNHEYTTAESSLKFAIKQTNSLMDQLNCQIKEICGPSSEYDQLLADCHNDLLVCETYQIETMAAVGNYEEAKKVLENLQAINNQTVNSYLAALCYNIGLDLYKLHLFEASTYWLQQSFKYGAITKALLLLAEVYLSWDGRAYYKEALNTVNMIVDKSETWECNYIKLKALIIGDAPLEALQQATSHLWDEMDLTEARGLKILSALLNCSYKDFMYNILNTLENKLDSIKKGDKIFENHLVLLLKDGLLSNAEKLIRSFILRFHNDGTTNDELRNKLSAVMENEALKLKDARNYMKAVVWFDYCIELANCFAKSTSGMTAVRIFHQKCSCLLELGWYDEAHEVLNLAETCSPSHLLNSYFKLKLCILQNKEQDACKVLELFYDRLKSEENDESVKILMTCEEFARRNLKYHIAINILEVIASSNACTTYILKHLLKLKLLIHCDFRNKSEHEWLVDFSSKVCHHLEASTEDRPSILIQAKWFVKILWNIAHLKKDNTVLLHQMMEFCNTILRLFDENNTVVLLQRITCLMLSVTSRLDSERWSSSTDTLKNILKNIEELKHLYSVAHSEVSSDQLPIAFRSTEHLLVVCEFEVNVKLQASGVEGLIERISTLHDADARIFEILAAIAFGNGDRYYSFSLRFLKTAITKNLLEYTPNYDHIGRLYHSMLYIIFLKVESDRSFENDFGNILSEIRDLVVSKKVDSFPQTELVWLVTKGWNISVKVFLRHGKDSGALEWAKTTIELANQLNSFGTFYQDKMNKIYTEMLSKTSDKQKEVKSDD